MDVSPPGISCAGASKYAPWGEATAALWVFQPSQPCTQHDANKFDEELSWSVVVVVMVVWGVVDGVVWVVMWVVGVVGGRTVGTAVDCDGIGV